MKSNWFYDLNALWIVVFLMAAMLLASELGYWVGRRWHADTHDAGREVFVAIKVSMLGLMALLLAFAFGMAANRFEQRQQLVTDEANMLHRVLLHSSFLPEPVRAEFQKSFRHHIKELLNRDAEFPR